MYLVNILALMRTIPCLQIPFMEHTKFNKVWTFLAKLAIITVFSMLCWQRFFVAHVLELLAIICLSYLVFLLPNILAMNHYKCNNTLDRRCLFYHYTLMGIGLIFCLMGIGYYIYQLATMKN